MNRCKAEFPIIKLTNTFKYASSQLGDKKRNKIWITSCYKDINNINNYYNSCVLITKDNQISIVYISGNINNKSVDIDLFASEKEKIKEIAYNYAKENNYLWESNISYVMQVNDVEEYETTSLVNLKKMYKSYLENDEENGCQFNYSFFKCTKIGDKIKYKEIIL